MLGVTPILENGRAEIQLHNGGKSTILINVLIWPEDHRRRTIGPLLSGQLIHLPPKTVTLVDITKAALAMANSAENVAVWIVFEVDPDCQRFPVRYELDVYDGLITRFVEGYRVADSIAPGAFLPLNSTTA